MFPQARFKPGALRHAGVPMIAADDLAWLSNELPNLCLLPDTENQYKSDRQPSDWLKLVAELEGSGARSIRIKFLDLQHMPPSVTGFEAFFAKRRTRTEQRLRRLLGV